MSLPQHRTSLSSTEGRPNLADWRARPLAPGRARGTAARTPPSLESHVRTGPAPPALARPAETLPPRSTSPAATTGAPKTPRETWHAGSRGWLAALPQSAAWVWLAGRQQRDARARRGHTSARAPDPPS